MQIELVSSVCDVPASEWDSLADGSPLASHGWLLTIEQTSLPQRPRHYLLGRDSDGLAAVLAAEIQLPDEPSRSLDHYFFGHTVRAMKALGIGIAPAVVVLAWLVRRDVPQGRRKRLAGALVDALERLARDQGWAIGFRSVTKGDFDGAGILQDRGYAQAHELPLTCLQVPDEWQSFADYRRTVRPKHRATEKSIRGEINDARKRGLRIERIQDVACPRRALHSLLHRHYQRLNHRPFPYRSDLIERLEANLGERALILTGTIGLDLAGVSIGVRAGDTVHMIFIGIDHDVGRQAAAYFNLSLNRPIEICIQDGTKKVYYGTLAYKSKAQRGCRIIPASVFVRGRSRSQHRVLKMLLQVHSFRMLQKFRFAMREIERSTLEEPGG